jgi:hypothetical protein
MTRDFAKELKMAGFPLPPYRAGHRFFPLETDTRWTDFARSHGVTITRHELENRQPDIADGYYCPSLADMLEACGDRFGRLYIMTNIWFAESADRETVSIGDSPEEAVGKLWLTLNGKAARPR